MIIELRLKNIFLIIKKLILKKILKSFILNYLSQKIIILDILVFKLINKGDNIIMGDLINEINFILNINLYENKNSIIIKNFIIKIINFFIIIRKIILNYDRLIVLH